MQLTLGSAIHRGGMSGYAKSRGGTSGEEVSGGQCPTPDIKRFRQLKDYFNQFSVIRISFFKKSVKAINGTVPLFNWPVMNSIHN